MRDTLLTLLTLFTVAQLTAPAFAQQQKKHPAFTLVSRVTVTRPDGSQKVSETTRYVSSGGSVREISRGQDGTVTSDYVYESGRGGFGVLSKDRKLVKRFGSPAEASDGPLPTAESLRADPNFAGTEQVLGYTAYVIRQMHEGQGGRDRDLYYAPELGRTPLKTVRYSGGEVFVVYEPVSVTFGEPEAALMKAPTDYEVRPMAPISGGVLNGKAVSKPAPPYPAEAKAAGASGVVAVQVLVSEDGTVESAEAVSGHPLLRDAAVEAAKRARFSPTRLSGQPVKVTGTVTYNFVLN